MIKKKNDSKKKEKELIKTELENMKKEDKKKLPTKRKDVKIRKASNKNTEFTAVKTSFNSIFYSNTENCFQTGLEDIVLNINKIAFLSYQLLNYHFTRLLTENLPLPVIDQPLFYSACSTVSRMTMQKDTIDILSPLYTSFSHYNNTLVDLPFRDYMGKLISNLNRQQLTATTNHLKLNFYKRLSTYIKIKTGETKKYAIYSILKHIYSEVYTGTNAFIIEIKKWLVFVPTEINIEKNLNHFIKIYFDMLKLFEQFPNTKNIRTFNLLPTKSTFTLSTIEICSSCLKDLIGYFENVKKPDDLLSNRREYWEKYFNISKFETRNRKFSDTIYTDGKVAVIRLQKPKQDQPTPKDIRNINYEQYIGIDPGVRSLQTSCNDKGRIIETTTPNYRHKCKMKHACKKKEMWYKKWDLYTVWKTIPTFKTSELGEMREYFSHVYPNLNAIFDFHMEKRFRGLNFTSYCMGKKVMNDICKSLIEDKKTLVGFGDFSQQHGLVKKHPTAPIKKFRNELKKHCDLIDIDEWGTSKTCSECFSRLVLYKNRVIRKNKDGTSKDRRKSEINSVVRCINNECKLCCIDRDVNASRNMLLLLKLVKEGKVRPECFKHQKINSGDTPS